MNLKKLIGGRQFWSLIAVLLILLGVLLIVGHPKEEAAPAPVPPPEDDVKVLVLNYHMVNSMFISLAIEPEDFDWQMKYLVDHGYHTISPDELYDFLTGQGTLPDRPEAVTDALRDFMNRFHVSGDDRRVCGLYGYTTFNAVRYFERIPVRESREERNDAPDIYYILYRYVIVINPFRSELRLVELRTDGEESGLPALEAAIDNRNYATYAFARRGPAVSTLTDEELRANVRQGIAHCMRGDVFQIVLSRRFIQPFDGDDFPVYRALRRINPSPYLFYFDFGGYRIFGSSPETHCKIEGQRAFIDPIAGTTRRTGDAPTDRRLTEALQSTTRHTREGVRDGDDDARYALL